MQEVFPMKKSDVFLTAIIVALAIIAFPRLQDLDIRSLLCGICLGGATLLFFYNVQRPVAETPEAEKGKVAK